MKNLHPEFDQVLTHCQLCGSEAISYLKSDFMGIRIWKCQHCKIEFMNPQYTEEYLNEFYGQTQEGESKHHKYEYSAEPRKLAHRLNLAEIEKHVPVGKFLSVGFGNGFDLEVALKRGWEAEGFDMDEEFNRKIAEKFKIPIYGGDLIELPLKKESYNCIYLNHVLEHPKNPGEYLEKIYSLLSPGGVLYIACPNINSLSSNFKNVIDFFGLRKKKAKHYDTWHHLFYYTPNKLKKLLEKHYNFRVLTTSNDIEITNDLKKESTLFPFPYKSAFRLLAQK